MKEEGHEPDGREVVHIDLIERRIPLQKIGLWTAIAVSVLGVWFVYASSCTDLSKRWLPYTQETAQLIVPETPDGTEPLELLRLTHSIDSNQITIRGVVRNRATQPIDDLRATIILNFVTGFNSIEKDVAVIPDRIEVGYEGLFQLEQQVNESPSGYAVKFKLANGGIVRHRDSRFLTIY